MSLAVASEDVPQAAAALDANWRSQLTEEEQRAADIVLDFEAEEMTCPACLTTFATGPSECPECGLFLGN